MMTMKSKTPKPKLTRPAGGTPRGSAFDVHCKQCQHEWSVPIILPMDLDRFLKAMAGVVALGCPHCGATDENVLCGHRSRRRPLREEAERIAKDGRPDTRGASGEDIY